MALGCLVVKIPFAYFACFAVTSRAATVGIRVNSRNSRIHPLIFLPPSFCLLRPFSILACQRFSVLDCFCFLLSQFLLFPSLVTACHGFVTALSRLQTHQRPVFIDLSRCHGSRGVNTPPPPSHEPDGHPQVFGSARTCPRFVSTRHVASRKARHIVALRTTHKLSQATSEIQLCKPLLSTLFNAIQRSSTPFPVDYIPPLRPASPEICQCHNLRRGARFSRLTPRDASADEAA
jgi:hypothetical protein